MNKKCGRSLQDITPLLANGNKPASSRPNLKLPLGKKDDHAHIVDQAVNLLPSALGGFRVLSRERILGSSVPVELIGVNFKGEPLIIKCASHCAPLFFMECLEALGIVKERAGSGLLDYPELNKNSLVSPRLVIVAATFAPDVFKVLSAVSALGIFVCRIVENQDLLEVFDYQRHDFFPSQSLKTDHAEDQVVDQKNTVPASGNNQLSLNLESELDEIRPLK